MYGKLHMADMTNTYSLDIYYLELNKHIIVVWATVSVVAAEVRLNS